jgi:hypothetical protein
VRRIRVVLLLATAAVVALGARAQEPQDGGEQAVASLEAWLDQIFVVPADLPVDASLRAEADRISVEHLARAKPMLREWLAEERAEADAFAKSISVRIRLRSRLINELALWALDGAGPAYDEATLAAYTRPGACRHVKGSNDFAEQIQMLEGVPRAARAAALAGERDKLSRWGRDRPNLPPRPARSMQQESEAAIVRIRAGAAKFEPALPPVVATTALTTGNERPQFNHPAVRCALLQWWLRVTLREGKVDRAEAVHAFRYALVPTAADRLAGTESLVVKTRPLGYPLLAAELGAEGVSTVEVILDAVGKAKEATVVERVVSVPGLRGRRPIAFETLFDEGALAVAAARDYAQLAAGERGEAVRRGRFDVAWSLRP